MKSKGITVKSKGKENKEVRTTVEEIENGYLIIRETNWNDSKKGYQYETKKHFSKSNPLEKVEKSLVDNFKD